MVDADTAGALYLSGGDVAVPEELTNNDPRYVSRDGDASSWDLRLEVGSEVVDAGDPAILDADESRA